MRMLRTMISTLSLTTVVALSVGGCGDDDGTNCDHDGLCDIQQGENAATCPDPAPGACLDKIKFTLATHSAGDANRTFIVLPNGDVIEEFDSAAFLEGAVVDDFMDPPFVIGAQLPNGLPDPAAFSGPTTAQSTLTTPITQQAVPSLAVGGIVLLVMLMLGLLTTVWVLRRRNAA